LPTFPPGFVAALWNFHSHGLFLFFFGRFDLPATDVHLFFFSFFSHLWCFWARSRSSPPGALFRGCPRSFFPPPFKLFFSGRRPAPSARFYLILFSPFFLYVAFPVLSSFPHLLPRGFSVNVLHPLDSPNSGLFSPLVHFRRFFNPLPFGPVFPWPQSRVILAVWRAPVIPCFTFWSSEPFGPFFFLLTAPDSPPGSFFSSHFFLSGLFLEK